MVEENEKKCFECGAEVDEEDGCAGCDSFICSACDVHEQMGFTHDPEDHIG